MPKRVKIDDYGIKAGRTRRGDVVVSLSLGRLGTFWRWTITPYPLPDHPYDAQQAMVPFVMEHGRLSADDYAWAHRLAEAVIKAVRLLEQEEAA